jgi:hypothetical protein
MNELMKKRMEEMEKRIKEQSENFIKFSEVANQKEAQLNNDISKYLIEISKLKNEMELLNNKVNNLTEEKQNNNNKISKLLKENEELKKKNIIKNSMSSQNLETKQKYENYIKLLKKDILNLEEDKKDLEEVVMKQENKVTELTSHYNNVKNLLKVKENEIKNNLEYRNKLFNSVTYHKKQLEKLKYKSLNTDMNENDIKVLKNEIRNMKIEMASKENKINLLSRSNKILETRVNKLTQSQNYENYYGNLNNNGTMSLRINKNKSPDLLNEENKKKLIISTIKKKSNTPINKKVIIPNKNEFDENIKTKEIYTDNYNYIKDLERKKQEQKDIKFNEIKEKYRKEGFIHNKNIEQILNKNEESEININFDSNQFNKEQTLKNINEIQYEKGPSINVSQEVEFPVFESYVVLQGENDENTNEKNDNENNEINKENLINNDEDDDNNFLKLHTYVNKILDEF